MSQPLLSILVPTVAGREDSFHPLMDKLIYLITKQVPFPTQTRVLEHGEDLFVEQNTFAGFPVEIVAYKDAKTITIGEKRERLYKLASGLYSWMIDDDDSIADNAIELILEAIEKQPDCITFSERCMMNGIYKSSNHSIRYEKWQDNFDGYDYVRSVFYKDVIKTDIAKSVPFPNIRYNEDEQWSMAIKPFLSNEIHIEQEIYYYNYEPKETHEERYGLNNQ